MRTVVFFKRKFAYRNLGGHQLSLKDLLYDRFNLTYIIFIIVTLIVPYGIFPGVMGYTAGTGYSFSVVIVAVSWILQLPSPSPEVTGAFIAEPYVILFSIPAYFPSILFAVMVLRCVRGKTSKRRALIAGIFSLIWPGGMFLNLTYQILTSGVLVYFGPLPIQFLMGYLILVYYAPIEVTQFDDERLSWWSEVYTEDEEPIEMEVNN
jgi:hypothetical protein